MLRFVIIMHWAGVRTGWDLSFFSLRCKPRDHRGSVDCLSESSPVDPGLGKKASPTSSTVSSMSFSIFAKRFLSLLPVLSEFASSSFMRAWEAREASVKRVMTMMTRNGKSIGKIVNRTYMRIY